MDISAISGISSVTNLSTINNTSTFNNTSTMNEISQYSDLINTQGTDANDNRNATFESLFQSALSMVNETNNYTNQAKEAEMAYAMGTMTSTHDLQIAQQKANISLQYTVAVRNAVLDAYKEIMQLQF